MKKALAPASKQTQGQPVWGRGHCTTALFLCQFAPQGGEKLRQVLPAEKPRVVAATPGNPQILKRKIAGFGIGWQACATGWQRPGKPLFLLGPGWNTTTGESPFHAHATPQNRAQKKRDSQRNADHKKALPPGQKKAGFSCGALLVAFLELVGEVFRIRAQTAEKCRTENRVASIVVCIPRELSYTTRAFRYHCTRGISKNHRYKKELHNGDAGAQNCGKLCA